MLVPSASRILLPKLCQQHGTRCKPSALLGVRVKAVSESKWLRLKWTPGQSGSWPKEPHTKIAFLHKVNTDQRFKKLSFPFPENYVQCLHLLLHLPVVAASVYILPEVGPAMVYILLHGEHMYTRHRECREKDRQHISNWIQNSICLCIQHEGTEFIV